MLILSPVVQIPTELEKLFVVVEHDLPSRQQIEEIARGVATKLGNLPGHHLAIACATCFGAARPKFRHQARQYSTGHDLRSPRCRAGRAIAAWLAVPPQNAPSHRGSVLGAKKLLDTKHPAFKTVTAIRGKVQSYWKSLSLPYPEPGVRLIRQGTPGG